MLSVFFVVSLILSTSLSQNGTESQSGSYSLDDANWGLGAAMQPSQLEVAGRSPDGDLYVARVKVLGSWGLSWVPGSGFFRGNVFYGKVGYASAEIVTSDCQALLKGGTKWLLQDRNKKIPPSAVIAGYDPLDGTIEYVCRGSIQANGGSWLAVGKLLQRYPNYCIIPFGIEIYVSSFEVLVKT